MKRLARVALLAGAMSFGLIAGTHAQSDKPLTILESVPGLTFPFFVHMMNQMKAEAEKLGNITVIESDGQVSSPKQTADIEAASIARRETGPQPHPPVSVMRRAPPR